MAWAIRVLQHSYRASSKKSIAKWLCAMGCLTIIENWGGRQATTVPHAHLKWHTLFLRNSPLEVPYAPVTRDIRLFPSVSSRRAYNSNLETPPPGPLRGFSDARGPEPCHQMLFKPPGFEDGWPNNKHSIYEWV